MHQIVKKIVFVGLGLSLSVLANAVPNVWTSDSRMGITEFNLVNGKNQAISLTCSSSAENFTSVEPSFSYIANWQSPEIALTSDISNTHQLSLKVDDKHVVYPHPLYWSEFLTKISTAKKIDVFSNNKKLATFNPKPQSIKKAAKYIVNDCSYELWR